MSRDVFVQDMPQDLRSVEDIDDGWRPGPLGVSYDSVLGSVRRNAIAVEAADPAWIHVEGGGVDVEVSIDPQESPLQSFTFHDRSGDPTAGRCFIGAVLRDLGIRAFDPTGSESGIFELAEQE